MPLFDAEAVKRLDRLLEFLAVTGGAALVRCKPPTVVAVSGDVDREVALSSIGVELGSADSVVHVPPDGLVAEVSANYRVFVRLRACAIPKPEVVTRIRRARLLLERFVVGSHVDAGPAPPSAAPAHAVVYAPEHTRKH